MSLIGPNRAFGKGEQKEQNAVIKVYTADQFKNALTKIYANPAGIGTIQIAGDIVITEPIILRLFPEELGYRNIIIQAVAGAKIICGISNDESYYYGEALTNRMPVFDFRANNTGSVGNPNITYTFKDININTKDSPIFGAVFGYNNDYSTLLPVVIINNINIINTQYLFGVYVKDITSTAIVNVFRNCDINNVYVAKSKSAETSLAEFKINSAKVKFAESRFNNFNIISIDNASYNNYWFKIDFIDPPTFSDGTHSIVQFINFNDTTELVGPSTVDYFVTFINCRLYNILERTSFTYINCRSDTQGIAINNFGTGGSGVGRSQHNICTDLTLTSPWTPEYTTSTETTIIRNSTTAGTIISYVDMLDDSEYEIDFFITIRWPSSSDFNSYHIKSHVIKVGSTPTIKSSTTIAAYEDRLTITGITPIVSSTTIRLIPTDGIVANPWRCSIIAKFKGTKSFRFT